MNTKILLEIVSVRLDAVTSNGQAGYVIGGIIALLIMCYLIYSLLRPEKF
jgi:K+-transporting ATPase KdpF subunit